MQSRYYDPNIGRFINADSILYTQPNSINGLNLYAYCGNNPVNNMYSSLLGGSHAIVKMYINGLKSLSNAVSNREITKVLSRPSMGFKLFGAELRSSLGWDSSPHIATGFFGRFGFSSYVTHAKGQPGVLYGFAGTTSDVMTIGGTTYYAGLGVNLFNILGAEIQFEIVGIGAQINIGNYTIGANINLIGGTSLTFGKNTYLGNCETETKGFTIGLNTGCLVAAICWIYKLVTTGDTSPIPGLYPS